RTALPCLLPPSAPPSRSGVAPEHDRRVVLIHAAPAGAGGGVHLSFDLAIAGLALDLKPAPVKAGHPGTDRVALPEQAARGVDRQVAVPVWSPLAHEPPGAALLAKPERLHVLHLLIGERVIRLGVVDLLGRILDARHLVREPRAEVGVVEPAEILVAPPHVPVGVRTAPDAAHPDGI